MTLPLRRRVAICLVALALSGALFRSQIASALVLRGDEATQAGQAARAIALYRRALFFQPDDVVAADRLAFALLARRATGDIGAAVDTATRALRKHPRDAALLVDRALGEDRLARFDAAERDFARAGTVARDARYHHFAGRVALKRGRTRPAIAYFHAALIDDARFRPARAALDSLRVR